MKRKHLLILLIAISTSPVAQAQITKGTYSLAGQVGFTLNKTERENEPPQDKNTSILLNVSVGKIIKENLMVGAGLFLISFKSEVDHTSSNDLLFGPEVFVRQYLPVVSRFYLYGHAALGGLYLSRKYPTGNYLVKSTGYNLYLSLTPGVSYAVTKHFYLESGLNSLGYINFNHEKRILNNVNQTYEKIDQFGIGGGFGGQSTFVLGLRVFL